MAPIYHALKDREEFEVELCSTGQHKEMLRQATKLFKLPVNYELEVMKEKQDLCSLTASILNRLQSVFISSKPDCILVHGDTTTSMAASIGAFYSKIPVGHVEAGLRTQQLNSPFPEEFNRRVNSIIATWHFAPTELNRQNLLTENIPDETIFVTGNTVVDALQITLDSIEHDSSFKDELHKEVTSKLDFDLSSNAFILVSCHRRENLGKGLHSICDALAEIAVLYPEINIIFPVHLNPNVRKVVYPRLETIKNIFLLEPLSYEMFCFLLNNCFLVLTDSGGVQEEAPSLGKPVLVMRETSERPEAITAGTVKLVGADKLNILREVKKLMCDSKFYQRMAQAHNPYGDGNAARRIVSALLEALG